MPFYFSVWQQIRGVFPPVQCFFYPWHSSSNWEVWQQWQQKNKISGVYTRACGRRARGVDQDTEPLSIREQGHWGSIAWTHLCKVELSFWVERKKFCRFSANFSLFGSISRYIHIEGGARQKQDANRKCKITGKLSSPWVARLGWYFIASIYWRFLRRLNFWRYFCRNARRVVRSCFERINV